MSKDYLKNGYVKWTEMLSFLLEIMRKRQSFSIFNICFGLLMSVILFSCGKQYQETKPIRKNVTETVFASGFLEAEGTYYLTAQTDGYLLEINFDEGDKVNSGQTLAIIDNIENRLNTKGATELFNIAQQNLAPNAPALIRAQNEVNQALQNLRQDSVQWLRYRALQASGSVSLLDLENAQLKFVNSKSTYQSAVENYKLQRQQALQSLINNKTQKELNNTMLKNNEIKAVVKGKVYKKYKQKGDFVKKGDQIAMIGSAELIYAKVSIDESNIGKVKPGQKAFIQLNTNKTKVYDGIVSEILPAFDEGTQSFTCKIQFKDPLDFTIVNTQLQCNINTGFIKNAMLIPRAYLEYGQMVRVKDKKDLVKVKTQIVSNEWVLIQSGISDADIILTEKSALGIAPPSETQL